MIYVFLEDSERMRRVALVPARTLDDAAERITGFGGDCRAMFQYIGKFTHDDFLRVTRSEESGNPMQLAAAVQLIMDEYDLTGSQRTALRGVRERILDRFFD